MKPANLVLTESGRVVLVDFGLSSSPSSLPAAHRDARLSRPPSSPPAASPAAPATSTRWRRPRSPSSPAHRPPACAPRGRASTPSRRPSSRRPSASASRPTPPSGPSRPASSSSGCAPAGTNRCRPACSRSASPTSWARPRSGRRGPATCRGRWRCTTTSSPPPPSVTAAASWRPRARATRRSRCTRRPARRVRAAIDIVNGLATTTWPSDLPLEIRVGIHTGETDRRRDDYVGPTLNMAARLRGLGEAGEVLVSQTTAGLVERHLPDGVGLVDLGPHRLRGVQRPEDVFAVAAPGVHTPPPATECPYPGLLSFTADDAERFFGREEVVDEIVGAPARHPVPRGRRRVGQRQVLGAPRRRGSAPRHRPRHHPGRAAARRASTPSTGPAGRRPVRGALHPGRRRRRARGVPRPPARLAPPGGDRPPRRLLRRLRAAPRPRRRRRPAPGAARAHGPRRAAAGHHRAGHAARVCGSSPASSTCSWPRSAASRGRCRCSPTRCAPPGRCATGARSPSRATVDRRRGGRHRRHRRRSRRRPRSRGPGTGAPAVPAAGRAGRGHRGHPPAGAARASSCRPAATRAGWTRSSTPVVGARLVTMDDAGVEVAHEALIREWPRLQAWLDEDRDGLRLQRHLTAAATAWDQLRPGPERALPRHPPGRRARLARHRSAPLRPRAAGSSTRAGPARSARSRRRSARTAACAAGSPLTACPARRRARRRRRRPRPGSPSDHLAAIGPRCRAIAAVSRSLTERQPDVGLLLAAEAYRRHDDADTRSTLLTALQTHPLLTGLLYGDDSGLEATVFTPDGTLLATPTSDGTTTLGHDDPRARGHPAATRTTSCSAPPSAPTVGGWSCRRWSRPRTACRVASRSGTWPPARSTEWWRARPEGSRPRSSAPTARAW